MDLTLEHQLCWKHIVGVDYNWIAFSIKKINLIFKKIIIGNIQLFASSEVYYNPIWLRIAYLIISFAGGVKYIIKDAKFILSTLLKWII